MISPICASSISYRLPCTDGLLEDGFNFTLEAEKAKFEEMCCKLIKALVNSTQIKMLVKG